MNGRKEAKLLDTISKLRRENGELQQRLSSKNQQVLILLDNLIELNEAVKAAGFDITRQGIPGNAAPTDGG